MKRLLSLALFGCGVLAISGAASAQNGGWDPYYRNDPSYRNDPGYRNDPYYRDDPNYRNNGYFDDRYSYGYGRNSQYLVDRVMADVDRAARGARLDGHEAHHFNEVARDLQEFESKWARGKFDSGKLDKAIHNLEHLAEADRVRGRDRDMLSRDLYDLRQFRASRGRY